MKNILITGATAGIGRACAEYLAAQNHTVIATGRNEKALNELSDTASQKGWSLHAFKLDVTDEENIKSAAEKVLKITDGRGLDVLVNNAGYEVPGFLSDLSMEQVKQQYNVNFFGLLAVTKAFLPQLIASNGKVINIGSMSSRLAAPWSGIYCTTKAAVRSLNDIMRVEFGILGVKVILIEPGHINTDFHATAIANLKAVNQVDSLYAATHQWMRENEYSPFYATAAIEPTRIARLVDKIILNKRAKSRYVIPFMAQVVMAISTTLPATLTDMMMRKLFHLYVSQIKT